MDSSQNFKQVRSVKGNLIIDYLKIIKANPDKPWEQHLAPEDFEQIKQMILPSSWYPAEMFQRMGVAIFKLVSGEDYNVVRSFGRFLAERMCQEYPSIVAPGNPQSTLKRYVSIQSRFFSYQFIDTGEMGPGKFEVLFFSEPEDLGPRLLLEAVAGTAARLVELSGGKEVKISINESGKPGARANSFEVNWQG